MHTHPNDVWIVVIKGAYLYKDSDGEKRGARENSSESREATNTGAVVTKRKARCFTRKDLGNSV